MQESRLQEGGGVFPIHGSATNRSRGQDLNLRASPGRHVLRGGRASAKKGCRGTGPSREGAKLKNILNLRQGTKAPGEKRDRAQTAKKAVDSGCSC